MFIALGARPIIPIASSVTVDFFRSLYLRNCCSVYIVLALLSNTFFLVLSEYTKNWRKRCFQLKNDGAFIGFLCPPSGGVNESLNNFTIDS